MKEDKLKDQSEKIPGSLSERRPNPVLVELIQQDQDAPETSREVNEAGQPGKEAAESTEETEIGQAPKPRPPRARFNLD